MGSFYTSGHPFRASDDFLYEVISDIDPPHARDNSDLNEQSNTIVGTEYPPSYSQNRMLYRYVQQSETPQLESQEPESHVSMRWAEPSRAISPQYGGSGGEYCQVHIDPGVPQSGLVDPVLLNLTAVGAHFAAPASAWDNAYGPYGPREPLDIAEDALHSLSNGNVADRAPGLRHGYQSPAIPYYESGIEYSRTNRISREFENSALQFLEVSIGRPPGRRVDLARWMGTQAGQISRIVETQNNAVPSTHSALEVGYDTAALSPVIENMDSMQQPNAGYGDERTYNAPKGTGSGDWKHPKQISVNVRSEPMSSEQSQIQTNRPPLPDSSRPASVLSDGVVHCPNCRTEFTGRWKEITRARHIRLYHNNGGTQSYTCEADGCECKYKRTDARLKHYRKKHKHLAPDAIVRRKTPFSTGAGSDQQQPGGPLET